MSRVGFLLRVFITFVEFFVLFTVSYGGSGLRFYGDGLLKYTIPRINNKKESSLNETIKITFSTTQGNTALLFVSSANTNSFQLVYLERGYIAINYKFSKTKEKESRVQVLQLRGNFVDGKVHTVVIKRATENSEDYSISLQVDGSLSVAKSLKGYRKVFKRPDQIIIGNVEPVNWITGLPQIKGFTGCIYAAEYLPSFLRVGVDVVKLALGNTQAVTKTNVGYKLCNTNSERPTFFAFTADTNSAFNVSLSPHVQTVRFNNQLTLTCEIGNTSRPITVEWFNSEKKVHGTGGRIEKNEEDLPSGKKVATLKFEKVEMSDAGTYVCQATNAENKISKASSEIVINGKPDPPSDISIKTKTSRSLTLQWTRPFQGGSPLKAYRVHFKSCVPGKCPVAYDDLRTLDGDFILYNLFPFTTYTIEVASYNDLGWSSRSAEFIATTEEEAPKSGPTSLSVSTASIPRALDIQWEFPPLEDRHGEIKSSRIYYRESKGSASYKYTTVSSHYKLKRLDGLKDWTSYSVYVTVLNNVGESRPSYTEIAKTSEAAPSKSPKVIDVSAQSSESLKVQWQGPPIESVNSASYWFVVLYRERDTITTYTEQQLSASQTSVVLTDLKKWKVYEVVVVTANSKGRSQDALAYFPRTAEDIPDAPPSDVHLTAAGSKSIEITWKPIPDDLVNGKLIQYKIVYKKSTKPIEVNVGSHMQHYLLTGLTPHMFYFVKIAGETAKGLGPYSKVESIQTNQTGPSAPTSLQASAKSSTEIQLSWQTPAEENGVIRKYVIYYGEDRQLSLQTDSPGSGLSTVVSGLKMYTKYFFKVKGYTVSLGQASDYVFETTKQGSPSPPLGVKIIPFSDTAIEVSWKRPAQINGILRGYRICAIHFEEIITCKEKSYKDIYIAEIGGLKPFTVYRIELRALTEVDGQPAVDTVKTQEGKPGKPATVDLKLVGTTISVFWTGPEEKNGIITTFKVSYVGKKSYTDDFMIKDSMIVPSERSNIILTTSVQPATNYIVSVSASTSAGFGLPTTKELITTAAAPPPPPQPGIVQESTTKSSIAIALYPASGENGQVKAYQVIVKRIQKRSRRSAITLPTHIDDFSSSQKKGLHMYITAELDNSLPDRFSVGDGNTYNGYYNAPLEVETKYSVYVRGITFGSNGEKLYGLASETILPPIVVPPIKDTPDPNIGIIAGIVGAILFILIIAVVFLLYKRVSTGPRNVHVDDESPPPKPIKKKVKDLELLPMGEENGQIPAMRPRSLTGEIKCHPGHPPVPVENFHKHVAKLHKNDDRGFMVEYSQLDSGKEFSWEDAHISENRNKNRYINIVAYDHSRVKLTPKEGEVGSDYINASFVDGYNKPNSYIATQGPLPATFNDFWRMIWDMRSTGIVMLTNLQEKHKLKCHKYWPEEHETYGGITVHMIKKEPYADYIIRTLILTQADSAEEREVRQFHFTVWPDHGVPDYATHILAFRRRVRAYNPNEEGPLIVHCSAGVGRSGTFIAIDSMLDRVAAEGNIDIFNFVRKMRTRRIAMVQTEEQYCFCHDAILEAIQCGNTQISAQDLRIAVGKLGSFDKDMKTTGFEDEWKTLNKVSPHLPKDCFVVATYPENKSKNRYADILAPDHCRAALTAIEEKEDTTYINAVYVDGYKQQNAFVLTQHPLNSTVNDFWRLVCEHECACIVMLNQVNDELGFPMFWPEHKSEAVEYDMISVECLSDSSNGGSETTSVDNLKPEYNIAEVTERRFRVTDARSPDDSFITKQFCYDGWLEEEVPPTTQSIISLIAKVEKWQQHSGNGPIIIMCNDGLGRSGTFAVLCAVLERVKVEQVIDVFQTIKIMRIQRPGVVKTLDQYKMVHYAVQEYLSAFDDYANFK